MDTANIPQAKAQFKRRSTANNVQISIPVPEDADTPRFRTNIGTVHYAPETSSIVWKIKQFGGGKEFLMRAELGLPSVRGDDEKGGGMMGGFGGSMGGVGGGKAKRPINVKFEIPYFTTSGIQVRYLKIIEPKVRTDETSTLTHQAHHTTAAIPIASLGTVHHSIWRHCCTITGRGLERRAIHLDTLNQTMKPRNNISHWLIATDLSHNVHRPCEYAKRQFLSTKLTYAHTALCVALSASLRASADVQLSHVPTDSL